MTSSSIALSFAPQKAFSLLVALTDVKHMLSVSEHIKGA